jgi:5-methylcytosine-specific restriction endonuclease McrA
MNDPKPQPRIKDQYAMHLFRLEHLGEPCDICELRPGSQVHHKVFRSQGGNDEAANLLWVCHLCHDDVHAGRIDRYALG